MEGKSFFEPLNLLLIAETDTFRNKFIGDLRAFLQTEDYNPPSNFRVESDITTFSGLFRDFSIISSPVYLRSDNPEQITSKLYKFQNHFNQPLNLNAIIIVMRPDPNYYEHFLSLNLFNSFCKDDMVKIEKNVMFVFMHNDTETYQSRDTVDGDLWSVLDRIGADLLHSKTFHCHSDLNKEFCNTFLQFICRNKKTLLVETFFSHESVVKVVGNEEFLDLLLLALLITEENINFTRPTGPITQNYISISDIYRTTCFNYKYWETFQVCCGCTEVKTKSHLGLCDALINNSTCTKCKCPVTDHKAVKYDKSSIKTALSAEQLKKYRHSIITIIVTIDLFHKENNASVAQLHDRIKGWIKLAPHYSILQTLHKNKMDSLEKGITTDDCMKCIWRVLPSLQDFNDGRKKNDC